jgi:hypothetical protein
MALTVQSDHKDRQELMVLMALTVQSDLRDP